MVDFCAVGNALPRVSDIFANCPVRHGKPSCTYYIASHMTHAKFTPTKDIYFIISDIGLKGTLGEMTVSFLQTHVKFPGHALDLRQGWRENAVCTCTSVAAVTSSSLGSNLGNCCRALCADNFPREAVPISCFLPLFSVRPDLISPLLLRLELHT